MTYISIKSSSLLLWDSGTRPHSSSTDRQLFIFLLTFSVSVISVFPPKGRPLYNLHYKGVLKMSLHIPFVFYRVSSVPVFTSKSLVEVFSLISRFYKQRQKVFFFYLYYTPFTTLELLIVVEPQSPLLLQSPLFGLLRLLTVFIYLWGFVPRSVSDDPFRLNLLGPFHYFERS